MGKYATGFKSISRHSISKSLAHTTRQYLVGNLSRPQILQHLSSNDLEIGITKYDAHTNELPHWHQLASEYQLMLEGKTTYRNSVTGEECHFSKGDFYLIETGTCYSQNSDPNTRILLIKVPSINDKTTCCHCRRECPSRLEPFLEDLIIQKSSKTTKDNPQ